MSGRSATPSRKQKAAPNEPAARRRFVVTLVRVLGVQVITLMLLWLLQSTFSY